MEKPFQKDLGHLSWDEVYDRQALRAHLVSDWIEALRLKSGNRVLEIGAGPGYVSFVLAERVGPAGIVYALDRSADALDNLERLQTERGVEQIRRIAVDAAALDPTSVQVDSALITMVLHHADDPAGILRNVARCVPPGAPVVIGEFHPEGPCPSGPPREHRLAPEKIQEWCKQAGLTVVGYRRQTPEHYVLFAQRGLDVQSAERSDPASDFDHTPGASVPGA
jgi:ubiquinone/menaquinone biosynthesis C-methylase UbiE